MASLLIRWADWFWKKVGYPTSGYWKAYHNKWDYGHTNGSEILNKDPLKDEYLEVVNRMKSNGEDLFPQLLALAERGSVPSMNRVAWYYKNGEHVAPDLQRAEVWWRRAFECGSDYGLLAYGSLLSGRGDYAAAEAVYRVGAIRDCPAALDWTAQCRLMLSRSAKTRRDVRPYLEKAVALGSPGAKRRLSRLMMLGAYGLRAIPKGIRLNWEWSNTILDQFRAEREQQGAAAAEPSPADPVLH